MPLRIAEMPDTFVPAGIFTVVEPSVVPPSVTVNVMLEADAVSVWLSLSVILPASSATYFVSVLELLVDRLLVEFAPAPGLILLLLCGIN